MAYQKNGSLISIRSNVLEAKFGVWVELILNISTNTLHIIFWTKIKFVRHVEKNGCGSTFLLNILN